MPTRLVLYAAIGTGILGGFGLVADAMVVSDEERLEELADELTSGHPDAVLSWTDLSQEDVRLQRNGAVHDLGEGDEHRLNEELPRLLEAFANDDLEVVQRDVEVDDDHGTVTIRARSNGELHDATLRAVRNGQGWLVTSVTAR